MSLGHSATEQKWRFGHPSMKYHLLVWRCAVIYTKNSASWTMKGTHQITKPCKYHPLKTCKNDGIVLGKFLPSEASAMLGCHKLEFRASVGALCCSCCERDIWHFESKIFLQPPNYLIIIMNRITYSNKKITENKSCLPLDLYIKLGPSRFSLQTSVDHHHDHGYSMNTHMEQWSLHSLNQLLREKHFTVTIIKLLNEISPTPIIHLLHIYYCTNSSWNVIGRQYVLKDVCRRWPSTLSFKLGRRIKAWNRVMRLSVLKLKVILNIIVTYLVDILGLFEITTAEQGDIDE